VKIVIRLATALKEIFSFGGVWLEATLIKLPFHYVLSYIKR